MSRRRVSKIHRQRRKRSKKTGRRNHMTNVKKTTAETIARASNAEQTQGKHETNAEQTRNKCKRKGQSKAWKTRNTACCTTTQQTQQKTFRNDVRHNHTTIFEKNPALSVPPCRPRLRKARCKLAAACWTLY